MRHAAAVTAALVLAACAPAASGTSPHPQSTAVPLQAIVSLTESWDATDAVLQRYQRVDAGAAWTPVGAPIRATVGRTGLAWGRGMTAAPSAAGPVKREGDGKAPAGIFRLGPAFGYAPADSVAWIRLPYVHSTPSVQCVDDPKSAAYNRLVSVDTADARGWTSHEEMRRHDGLYRLGLWVSHNDAPPAPGGGSCIFMHIWQAPGVPTVGCTAMDAADLEALLRWLDPRAAPVLVQAPRGEIAAVARATGLPASASTAG